MKVPKVTVHHALNLMRKSVVDGSIASASDNLAVERDFGAHILAFAVDQDPPT
jgi:hypothetical protein